jgi:hypothetical protein
VTTPKEMPDLRVMIQGLPMEEASPRIRSYLDSVDGATVWHDLTEGGFRVELKRGGETVGEVRLPPEPK